jgi:hypothetical protein
MSLDLPSLDGVVPGKPYWFLPEISVFNGLHLCVLPTVLFPLEVPTKSVKFVHLAS